MKTPNCVKTGLMAAFRGLRRVNPATRFKDRFAETAANG
jgi:hypothetical protein